MGAAEQLPPPVAGDGAWPAGTVPDGAPLAESATRLAVLWVPDWPIAAAVAEGLIGAHHRAVLHDGRGVTAVSAMARAQGVRRGMRRRTAQGLCPDLVLLAADEARDVRAFEPLVQGVEEVVPHVQVMRPGVVAVGARGPSRYLGSEEAVAEALVGAVAQASGAEAQVGIADGLLAALLAARTSTVVPPGRSARFLAPRDVRDLIYITTTRQSRAAYTDLVDLLRRLGLSTLGDLAAMRTAHVLPRFGELGVQAQRLARGLDAYPPQMHRPEPDITTHAELDPPAQRIDTAAFAARRLAEELQSRMVRRGVVCARLRVSARADNGAELVRTWRIDGALTATELTDRVRWQLEGWLSGRSGRPPSAPLTHLELAAEEISPAAAVQDGLWGRVGRGQVQADRAVLRVQGLIGAEGVLSPVLEGGRSPRDRVRLVAWGDELRPLRDPDAPWPGQIPRPLPATVPAEPVPARLVDAQGDPVRVGRRGELEGDPALVDVRRRPSRPAEPGTRGAGSAHQAPGPAGPARRAGPTGLTGQTITGWAGPWPVHERWWSGTEPRTYLQVVTEGGALLLAGEGGRWWVEGVYD
ncbi:DNA polymerase Y family protein [Occultella glacieicola]|uniref:DNA polymerase Y family protein n=1 Tax=Occultella glacieicola TaxID=2518684 RepID=A0ABY2E1S9_9MICO|nr:DNA polymerase Y family protein [Occultella glacieicola]TDE90332.1 DNA polymerase Y family protein [Occultella glacieicola]